jgi:hypothetical protein
VLRARRALRPLPRRSTSSAVGTGAALPGEHRRAPRARGWSDGFRIPLRWLLARLAAAGLAVAAREAAGRRPAAPDVDLPRCAPSARGGRLVRTGLRAPRRDRGRLPARRGGETTGDAALFRKAALWFAYFSNANAYYALNNRVTAAARRRACGREATVLEVGAGPGSASEALLELLRDTGRLAPIARYR